MNKNRPVNLELGTLKFPPMAIASILHRISGIVIFLLLPLMLYFLEQSLISKQNYQALLGVLAMPLIKLVIWGFLAATIYHLFAGIRHIIMDFGVGETVEAGRMSSIIVIVAAVVAILLLGVWIW